MHILEAEPLKPYIREPLHTAEQAVLLSPCFNPFLIRLHPQVTN